MMLCTAVKESCLPRHRAGATEQVPEGSAVALSSQGAGYAVVGWSVVVPQCEPCSCAGSGALQLARVGPLPQLLAQEREEVREAERGRQEAAREGRERINTKHKVCTVYIYNT